MSDAALAVKERTIRRLAAILAADVVGYSKMMAKDETGTLSAKGPLALNPVSADLKIDLKDFGLVPLQPYFDSGFPYAHDQWISAAGTSWASMALSLTVERPKMSRR
jgi:hypothetical protein